MSRRGRSRRGTIGGGGVSPPSPLPTYGLLSDTQPASSALTSWAPTYGVTAATQGTPAARPAVVQDPVSGLNCVRIDTGQSLVIPAGTLDFLSQGTATLLVVWRGRKWSSVNADLILLDSSANGGNAGYQLRAQDNPGTSKYRWVNGRISNGSSFIIDHNSAVSGPFNSYAPLKTCITTMQTSASRTRLAVDSIQAYDDAIAVTLPAGAAGPMVIGGGAQVDIFAVLAWSGGITDVQLDAWTSYVANQFNVDTVQTLAGDAVINPDPRPPALNYYGFPSMCIMANGVSLVALNPSQNEGGMGSLAIRTSPTGNAGTWSAMRTLIPYNGVDAIHDIVATTMLNNDIVLLYAIGITQQWYIKSSDNGATWSAPARITRGYDLLEFSATRIFEEGNGEWRVQMYTQSTGDAHWDCRLFVSHDHGATFPADILVANGIADSADYAEIGEVTLGGSNRLAVVRDVTNAQMLEYTSANASATWGGKAFAFAGNSAARMIHASTGDVVMVIRPSALLATTLTMRLGAGSWTALPDAPCICCAPSANEYGEMTERTPGTLDVVFGAFYGAYAANTYFRRWPIWQLKGQMPLTISGASSVAAGGTIQFTATGAGNFAWSLSINNSGGSIDSVTGIYTAGVAFGNVTDTVQVTDLNGYSKTTNVTVGASAWTPWTLSSCKFWVDTVASAPSTSGGNLTTWADLGPLTTTMVPGSGAVPVTASDAGFNNRPSLTLGSAGSWLKSSANLTFGPFTQFAVIATAATGYVSVHNVDGGGNGDYWYTASPGLATTRSGVEQDASSTAWVTAITTGAARVVECIFDGVSKANTALLVDGVNKAIDSVTNTNLDTTTAVGKLYIGGNAGGGGNLAGKVAAYGVFDGTLSAGDRSNIRFYLKKLYGTA